MTVPGSQRRMADGVEDSCATAVDDNSASTRANVKIHADLACRPQRDHCTKLTSCAWPTFCFTGVSVKYSRNDFLALVAKLGGRGVTSMSPKVNYLVIAAEGNPCWAYSCYGRKVEKAVQLRKSGIRVVVVHENDGFTRSSLAQRPNYAYHKANIGRAANLCLQDNCLRAGELVGLPGFEPGTKGFTQSKRFRSAWTISSPAVVRLQRWGAGRSSLSSRALQPSGSLCTFRSCSPGLAQGCHARHRTGEGFPEFIPSTARVVRAQAPI